MDAVVRHLHPAGPSAAPRAPEDADAQRASDAGTEALNESDRQAYWDDLAALRARLAELRAG